MKIESVKAREILDSRGWPTIEVILKTSDFFVKTSVPSGASKGKYESIELRDGEKRYQGKGVLKAVKNVNEIIGPKLTGKNPVGQEEIDNLIIELDGTKNKSNLGANAILAVSMAVCRAGAVTKKIPLYQYINQISNLQSSVSNLPLPCFNIINGGVHAGNDLDFQEFMICPQLDFFAENLRAASEIYHCLREILKSKIGQSAINIGDEGGFAPPLIFPEQVLDLILEATEKAGYKNSIKIIVDSAANEFYVDEKYKMKKFVFTKEGLLNFYLKLLKKYPIIALEDPFGQDDWEGWQMLNAKYPGLVPPPKRDKGQNAGLIIFGDDLLATNIQRIKEANKNKACNGLVLKVNQIGTVTEALEAGKIAKDFGWKIMVSHRSGETVDDFIADLAVGIGAEFIKSGAPARGERVAKYNRLLEIEKELFSGR